MDDLEAFKFEKNPFEGSRLCIEVSCGVDGNGGRDVNSGDSGCPSADESGYKTVSAPVLIYIFVPLGEGEPLPASVGEVIVLLIIEVRFGIARESEVRLGMLLFLEDST